MQKCINKSTLIFGLLLSAMQWRMVSNQTSEEALKCTQFKKSVFEKEKTFSAFFPGAPIIKKIIDHCQTYAPLIVGGRPAEPKEFPHIARIGIRSDDKANETRWICGGTLITEKYVLTAAHCFEAEEREINVVRLGDLDFSSDTDDAMPKDYAIRDYFPHEEFKGETLYNDIGLIELAENVIFDRYKHPACLPFDDGNLHESFITAGWGDTGFSRASSDKLLKVKLDRFLREDCKKTVTGDEFPEGYNYETQMCVGSDQAKDTCNGDSGGPLLVYHKEYQCMYHVMGVTSAGIGGCGTPNVPSVYTRVFHYLDWIKKKINK